MTNPKRPPKMSEVEAEQRLADPRPIDELELSDIFDAFGYTWRCGERNQDQYVHETYGVRAGFFSMPESAITRTLTEEQRYIVCRMIAGLKLERTLREDV